MRCRPELAFIALVILAAAGTAAAQPPLKAAYEPPTHCSSLDLYGGVSSAESTTGGLAGGGAGWQIVPWFGIEGEAFWVDRPGSENGFSAAVHARWNLARGWRVRPFAKTGAGFYRASFDKGDDTIPAFYRDRLESGVVGIGTNRAFTDPAVIAGGGVDILLSRRVSLRPQADALVAFDHGKRRVMPAFTVHLAFHFDEHPITSSRP
jgi:hypothetical protein